MSAQALGTTGPKPEGASMTGAGHAGEKGFSLIELLVAMVITLIVSGAIYGLLAGGQNAFRREPELTERQQNIRMAMDIIMKDISNAGAGLPAFMQVFTTGLDACSTCPNGGSGPGPSGAIRDELELITSTGRDTEPACVSTAPPTPGTDVQHVRQGVNIPAGTFVSLKFAGADVWTLRRLLADSDTSASALAGTNCTGLHTTIDLSPDSTPTFNASTLCVPSVSNTILPPMGNAPGASNCVVEAVAFPRVVRYRIRDDAAGVPMLERFSTDNLAGGFQPIARGIEDLQVQYTTLQDPTVWVDDAPVVPPAVATPLIGYWDDLTAQVRVTLAARSEARNIQGAVNNALGTDPRLRGSLTSTGTPRAVLMHVAHAHPASPYPPSPASWYWE
jgi:prepilin-type N-terminal cleavage/methylation domain-containing protein